MKSTSKIINVLPGLMFGLIVLFVSSQAFAQGDTWETKAPMPSGRGVQATGVIDGKLYAPGVDPTSSFASVLDVYDQATDTWNRGRASPTPRGGNAAGVIGDKLYVVGGCIGFPPTGPDCRIGTTNLLEVYDPDSDTWTTLPPMPTARGFVTAAVIVGKLHVVGGNVSCGACTPLSTHEVYDPATNTWLSSKFGEVAPMPVAVNTPAAVAIGGKLYVVGGGDNLGTTTGILQVYDTAANTWDISNSPMPTDRFEHAVGVINGRLYATGGVSTPSVIVDTLEEYDPAMDTWVTRTAMPTARWALGAGVIDGKLYVAGGADTSGANVDTLEVYTPPLGPSDEINELIATVISLDIQKGISTSLDAKLDTVLQAIDDVNQNNDIAAINSLNAFINAVEAQRDKKITDAEADDLIEAAQGIIALLGG